MNKTNTEPATRATIGSLNQYFDLESDSQVPHTLFSYFDRVREGSNPHDIGRTELFKGRSYLELRDEWMDYLDAHLDDYPGLLKFEHDLAKKIGPMSIMKPLSKRLDDVASYYEHAVFYPNTETEELTSAAINTLMDDWRGIKHRVRIQKPVNTVKSMKLSTSSGSPFWTKRRSALDRTMPFSLSLEDIPWSWIRRDQSSHKKGFWNMELSSLGHDNYDVRVPRIHYPSDGNRSYSACAILGWRGQEGGPSPSDVKQRTVWMFPFAVNIAELSVYQPLIKAMQNNGYIAPWISNDAVDDRITLLFDTKDPDDLVICTDFTKFDQHFNTWCQIVAQRVLSRILAENSAVDEWFEQVFDIKYTIPLLIDKDILCIGRHGMGSGSGGTNADETLTHSVLQRAAAIRDSSTLNPNSMCLGDDGILSYPGITVDSVVSTYQSFGLDMNTEKQSAHRTECTFLRRWHSSEYRIDGRCVGVYATSRALGHLLFRERSMDIDGLEWKEVTALRQLSIMQNLEYHPLREKFADFVIKGDRYRLGKDIPGFLDHIVEKAQIAIDQMPDFMGYVRGETESITGMDGWWIVQYLKSLE